MAQPSHWCRFDPKTARCVITVHVQPNAHASAVAGVHGDALKIRVAAPAVEGKANAALIAFLCERLGLTAQHLAIRQGAHGRRKLVEVAAGSGFLPELARRLAPY